MSKTNNLTKDQLEFISYIREMTLPYPKLNDRFKSCIARGLHPQLARPNQGIVLHHSPHKMIEFLSLFSKDDHFKWYTHKWDQDELTLKNMIDVQPKKRLELSNWVYKTAEPINERTYNQIWNFINFKPEKEYPWTDNSGKNHQIGWHSILELHKKTPDLPVENLKLPDGNLFKDYIRLFKSSIEFRTDLRPEDKFNKVVRNSLKIAINGAVELEFSQNFKKIGPDINIYCDVPAVVFGLGIICDWIVKHKAYGSSSFVDLTAHPQYYELVIFHKDSYFSNEEKLIKPSGDFAKLRNRLFSVCDLTLNGDLKKDGEKNGSIIVYGLSEETKKESSELSNCPIHYSDEPIGGVKYILKLYKS